MPAKPALKGLAEDRLSLPTEKSEPCTNLEDFVILLYGREKIGKTTMLSHFDRALFLMFEPGGKALSIFKREVLTWVDFKAYIKLLHGPDGERFRTIVIDTVDLCYRLCLEYVIKFKLAGQHPGEEKYGKGWDALRDEFSKTMAEICKLGKGVVFVSHDKERTIKKMGGGEYDIIGPTLQDAARSTIEPMADIFAYYYYDSENRRKLKLVGDSESLGGTRLKEQDRFFKGIDEVDMGTSSKQAYDNFVAAMNNKPSSKLPPRGGKR